LLRLLLVIHMAIIGMSAEASLKAFYTFEDSFSDISGNGYVGNPVNDPGFTVGYEGRAIDLVAADSQYVSFDNLDINPGVMPRITFGGWFRADLSSPIRGVLSHDSGFFDRTIDIDSRGNPSGWSAFRGNSNGGVVGGAPVVIGAWTFVAVRHDQANGQLTLFVNDEVISATGVTFGSGWTSLALGRNPSFDMPFDGGADNVFVFDDYLSNDQINGIRLGGASAILSIPEPSTYAMLLVAIGLMCCFARRRA